jgi:hypothetical protein
VRPGSRSSSGPFADRVNCNVFAADHFKGKLATYAFVLAEHVRGSTPMLMEPESVEVKKAKTTN